MNGLIVLFFLLSIVPLAMLTGRATAGLPPVKKWALFALLLSLAWFGLFLIAGVFLNTPDQPTPPDVGWVMVVLGLLFCAPLGWRLWRQRAAPTMVSRGAPMRPLHGLESEVTAEPSTQISTVEPHAPVVASPPEIGLETEIEAMLAESDAHLAGAAVYSFDYEKPGGDPHERQVLFLSHSYYGGDLYLNGYDVERGDHRSFKAQRIVALLTDTDTGEMVTPESLAAALPEVEPPFGDGNW